jgi:uncharacterized protein YciI
MMRMQRAAALWLVLLTLGAGHGAAQDYKLTTYYLVVLMKGKAWSAEETAERTRIQAQHIAHLTKLGDQGVGLAAGPFTDNGDIRGLLIVTATSAQQARELEAADPAVQAARLAIDVLPFMAPEGWFHKPAMPFSMETVYFGFLNAGPTRFPDEPTANRVQSEHMAYMTAQNKEGRLILAGPFVSGGSRSGLVVYRAASATEARRLAEGDPMVKFGRLEVELHEWYLAKGVLK